MEKNCNFLNFNFSYVCEVLPQLVPILADLGSQLDNIEWVKHTDMADGQLVSTEKCFIYIKDIANKILLKLLVSHICDSLINLVIISSILL